MSVAPSAQYIPFPASDTRPGGQRVVTTRTAWRSGLPQAPANDNDADPGPLSRVRPKLSLGLEGLIEWTYRRQRAHAILRAEMDWVLWAMDRAGYIANPADCRKLHYDAALVHEAVLALGTEAAAMVITAAMFGDWPRWIDESISRPRPAEPRDPLDDFGYHRRDDGTRFRYLKRTFDIVSVPREEYEPAGRKKMRRATTETFERVPVDGCVVEWSPEPEFIAANNRLVVMWETARPVLAKALRDAPFKYHILADDRIAAPLAVAANDNAPIANDNEPDQAAALG
jgi:hypothetical protein